MLVDAFNEPCVLMERMRVPDGEGGFSPVWTEGASFMAAIVCDSSLTARIAEKEGVTATYTITTAKNAPLSFHDVIRRKDGTYLRVTNASKSTPDVAGFDFAQVNAERWEL